MKLLVHCHLLLTLLLLISLSSSIPVGKEALSSEALPASRSRAISKKSIIAQNVNKGKPGRNDVVTKLKNAGIHSGWSGTELHEKLKDIFPIQKESRPQTIHTIRHLKEIGVQPEAIRDLKKARRNESNLGNHKRKKEKMADLKTAVAETKLEQQYMEINKNKALRDQYVAKIDLTSTPDVAVKDWQKLGKAGRSGEFGRHLHGILKEKVASGTHTQAWKDEFIKKKSAILNADNSNIFYHRHIAPGKKRRPLRRKQSSLDEVAASTSATTTTPTEQMQPAASSIGSTSTPESQDDAALDTAEERLPSPPKFVPRRARSKTFVVQN
jgi:DNA-binding transcriptional MerR regulator